MKLALAGDAMLGRKVAERLASGAGGLFSDEVLAVTHEADLFVVNLECAISARGRPFPDPAKPFFFRAPPIAAAALRELGVSCVNLANNHALDFGTEGLLDTLAHLTAAGIAFVGAGVDEAAARSPAVLDGGGGSIEVIGVTDHPSDYAATPGRPGVAYADLRRGTPSWLLEAISGAGDVPVLVSPHWGPNMAPRPVAHVRRAAAAFRRAGASLVAGHSAHVFHGVTRGILYDLGDFVDDYAVDPLLRNDLGLLFLVGLEGAVVGQIEAVPLYLDYCRTRLARGEEWAQIAQRLRLACAELGTEVTERDGRLVVELPSDTVDLSPPR